jgi:hypothetical protein
VASLGTGAHEAAIADPGEATAPWCIPPEREAACFHCGEANPPGSAWHHVLEGKERTFCCAGCLGVAQTIRAAGLESFYLRRTARTERRGTADEQDGACAPAPPQKR